MKKKPKRLYFPSFGRCGKAALWIVVIAAAAGIIVASYDWLVIAITNMFMNI